VAEPPAYRCRQEARHESVQLRGLEIHLRRWGPTASADVAPLYCLHGWLDCGDTFQFLVDEFAGERPVVAFDWRGFGRSAWAQGEYAFTDYLADLDALLQLYTPAAPAMLLGHSMGGNIACLYAGVRPERVRCVVNLEGFGLPPSSPSQAPKRLRQWLSELQQTLSFNDYDSFDQLAAAILRRHPRIEPSRARFLAGIWAYADEQGRIRLWGDPRHKRIFPTLYRREESEAVWREIAAPMLALAGENSSYIAQWPDADALEEFRRCVPSCTVSVIEGAGHLLHLEQPEKIAPLIEAFVYAH
jgi:pimeloyl-ACP methyl ester carboxylesterase